MPQRTVRMIGEIFICTLLVSGCARHEPAADLSMGQATTQKARAAAPAPARSGSPAVPAPEPIPAQPPLPEDFTTTLARQGRTTPECFQLRPGGGKRGGRCEPQSLPFARCRSGIDSCRIGYENGPLTWFACEKARGNTSLVPRSGSILILAANTRRKMPTGHVAYVEEVVAQSDTVYRLTFTHTNYDRKCSLESNIKATYDRGAQTLDIHTGAWGPWGKGLPVAGFILN